MALPKWNDIPVSARKSLRKYHKYLESLEEDGESSSSNNNDNGGSSSSNNNDNGGSSSSNNNDNGGS